MSYEIGIDLVEIARIEALLSDTFINRILSKEEKLVYDKITHHDRKLTFLAGRFSAKEALFQALKTGDNTANYKDFTILNEDSGAPYFKDFNKPFVAKVSITHTQMYAMAFVILEKIE